LTAPGFKVANGFAFGPFLLIPERQQLLVNQEALRLGGRAFELLTVLVERQGTVVSKQELIARGWPGLVVEEQNLKVNISAIRRLLGDSLDPPRYIETVVGVGYRFVAEVGCLSHSRASQSTPPRARSGNLKPLEGQLYGRDAMLLSVQRDLQDSRVVSLVGPGGIGKTTVAMAVAHRSATAFDAGAWCVDLAQLDDSAAVTVAVADVLRESAIADEPRPLRNGRGWDHEVLLVLDNCEHLIGAVAACADQLLANTRHVKLLTTSREPLSIRGELVRRLSGLDLPPEQKSLTAEQALKFAAVQLFVDRAEAQPSAFHLDDTNAADVAAICRRLDGHTLAIERVARRVGTLGVAGTLDHLARRFHMLDGHHEGPDRHRTLTATVATSYDLLSASEQMLLRRLSVFEGPFSLAAACDVGAVCDMAPAVVVDGIGQLVAKSLLVAEVLGAKMHYRQTQLTRAFAIEQLAAHGELDRAQRRVTHPSED
jgi:predicted ATPase/DNA-binding winged helix-turn-helix (wHTH) protein